MSCRRRTYGKISSSGSYEKLIMVGYSSGNYNQVYETYNGINWTKIGNFPRSLTLRDTRLNYTHSIESVTLRSAVWLYDDTYAWNISSYNENTETSNNYTVEGKLSSIISTKTANWLLGDKNSIHLSDHVWPAMRLYESNKLLFGTTDSSDYVIAQYADLPSYTPIYTDLNTQFGAKANYLWQSHHSCRIGDEIVLRRADRFTDDLYMFKFPEKGGWEYSNDTQFYLDGKGGGGSTSYCYDIFNVDNRLVACYYDVDGYTYFGAIYTSQNPTLPSANNKLYCEGYKGYSISSEEYPKFAEKDDEIYAFLRDKIYKTNLSSGWSNVGTSSVITYGLDASPIKVGNIYVSYRYSYIYYSTDLINWTKNSLSLSPYSIQGVGLIS